MEKLNMNGTIKMKGGKVKFYLKEKDTGKKLYSEEFTAGTKKEVLINIDNLDKNKDLVLELEGTDVKDFKLKLNSKQKLAHDKEVPLVPNKPSR
jgi:hypothetical protein